MLAVCGRFGPVCYVANCRDPHEKGLNVKPLPRFNCLEHDPGSFFFPCEGLSQGSLGSVIIYKDEQITAFNQASPKLVADEIRQEFAFEHKLLLADTAGPSFAVYARQFKTPCERGVSEKENSPKATHW